MNCDWFQVVFLYSLCSRPLTLTCNELCRIPILGVVGDYSFGVVDYLVGRNGCDIVVWLGFPNWYSPFVLRPVVDVYPKPLELFNDLIIKFYCLPYFFRRADMLVFPFYAETGFEL